MPVRRKNRTADGSFQTTARAGSPRFPESALVSGFAIYVAANFKLRFGALVVLFVLGNVAAAAAFTNDTPLPATVLAIRAIWPQPWYGA